VGNSHSGVTLHGPGGIFSTFGLERDIIVAHVAPEGLISHLPVLPSIDVDPRYGTITGVTESYGSQPDETCEDAPTAYMKGCNLTGRFGLLRFDTNTIEIDEVIKRYNRGDFTDLRMLGSMFGDEQLAKGLVPRSSLTADDILNVATLAEMMVVGVQVQRELVRQTWQGNVLIPNEFPGLDGQIATGQLDADVPGKLCTGLDSDIKNFGYSSVDGEDKSIVSYLSMLAWYLKHRADRSKLNPVKWTVVMRPELWFELSAVWPCSYLSNRCADSGTSIGVINDELNVNLRDRMRRDMVLPINGVDYPVVVDDGIYEHTAENNQNLAPGEFASSIYIVPMTILGNFPVCYREYLDYQSPLWDKNTAMFNQYRKDFWTDSGMFSWAYEGRLWCYKLGLKTEQRIILRTPQLAGRVDYVKYAPTQHLASPFPDSDYFVDGGVSVRPAPRTSYAVYSSNENGELPEL